MVEKNIQIDFVKERFRNFYFYELEPSEFDKWICNTSDKLEPILGNEAYLGLAELKYSNRDDIDKAMKLIEIIYGEMFQSDIYRDRVHDLLEGMISGKRTLTSGCKLLWDLSLKGVDYIPMAFAGYASEIDDQKWESLYRERVLKDTIDLLNDMNK